MAGLIRRSDIDEVRSRINIADVLADYVTLKSAGVGSLKGLCPFHDERSPSFHVRPQAGRYHCFGCGEDGDVFTFLQKTDHVTFSEAVERMAARVGIELHYEDGAPAEKERGNRARLLAANEAASEFFVAQLATPRAEPGRVFLGSRGFDPAAAAHFGVGFAPKSYDALSKHLLSLGFTVEELLAAGLVGEGDRGMYDRFRGRLVWPIRDTTGQTLGFGARKLLEDDQGPKYLNTPETSVYHKSQVLYGLDLAKRDISRGKKVVVVEGYTDVMACHLAGVTTAVATCGTAFGVDHIKIIRRVLGDVDNADSHGLGEVIFTFDPDEAGQKAASRAFAEEQRFAAQTYVAVAPDGLDPCDLRLERGDEAIRRLVDERKPMFEFMIRRVLASYDLDTVEGRVGAVRAAAPVLASIRDAALHSGYIRSVAGWIGVDPKDVVGAVAASRKSGAASAPPSRTSRQPDQGQREQEQPMPRRQGDGQSGASPVEASERGPSITHLPSDPLTRLERDALMAILQQPEDVGRDLVVRVASVAFSNPTLQVVRDGIATSMDAFATPQWVERVAGEVPSVFSGIVNQLVVAPIPEKSGRERSLYSRGVVESLIGRDLLATKAELLGRLQRTDASSEPDRYRELQRELMSVESERRKLIGE